MSIIYCEKHDHRWNSDRFAMCPICRCIAHKPSNTFGHSQITANENDPMVPDCTDPVSGPKPATASSVLIEQPMSERERNLVEAARFALGHYVEGPLFLKMALDAYKDVT